MRPRLLVLAAASLAAGCGGEPAGPRPEVRFLEEPEIRAQILGRGPDRPRDPPKEVVGGYPFVVKEVLPGGRLELENDRVVRLLGVLPPPPESEAGKALERWLVRWCEGDPADAAHPERRPRVVLEFDAEPADGQGTPIAWAFLEIVPVDPAKKRTLVPQRVFLSGALVGLGLARAWPAPPNLRYAEPLETIEEEARRGRLGIWSDGRPPPPGPAFVAGKTQYHLKGCPLAGGAADRPFRSPLEAERAGLKPCPACRPGTNLEVPKGVAAGPWRPD